MSQTVILTEAKIRQKIRRIAYEIYENHFKEKDIYLVGIQEGGFKLAELLVTELEGIASFNVHLIPLELDKLAPTQSEIKLGCDTAVLKNKSVIIIDDVLNTGRTLVYSLKPFLNVKIKTLEVAVLVNRSHTQFPVSCKYTGYELSTTITDHVTVNLRKSKQEVLIG
jgi:pyrimidine operon attenuation protein/uracil phosphoribosyltransferase